MVMLLIIEQIILQFTIEKKISFVFFNIKRINYSVLIGCILSISKGFRDSTTLVTKTRNKYRLILSRSILSFAFNNIQKSSWSLFLDRLYIAFTFVTVSGFLGILSVFVYIKEAKLFSDYFFCKKTFFSKNIKAI